MAKKETQDFLSNKIGGTRIVSLSSKIIVIFTIFVLASNFTSNYINLVFNRSELIKLMKELLVKDLKSVHNSCNSQYEIYQFNNNLDAAVNTIEKRAESEFQNKKSVALGVRSNAALLFQASKMGRVSNFTDTKTLALMLENRRTNVNEGSFTFIYKNEEYFGVYKYNAKWDAFLVRGEEVNEFYEYSSRIFWNITIIIAVITGICALIGIFVLQFITRYIKIMTNAIMRMSRSQQMGLIDLKNATNDDVTFLGMAFNSLSNTISNLLNIFRKFVNKDIANQAYREKEVRLEGTQKELSILFSDIKSFTFITETLGSDIIKLLNLHYTKAIREIFSYDGIIGSIIGDALLAVYGALDESADNKSYQAVQSGYRIQEVAASLRLSMHKRREEIIKKKGSLTDEEERVYKAVLLEVGVGIDGGNVFYGNIGSHERMTNTVIGDNVNSASRLEGLTRVYKVPVICSEYIKDDIEKNVRKHNIIFAELDMVQVKGKTVGRRVFWPILSENYTDSLKSDLNHFSKGLDLYYKGSWKDAYRQFARCGLPLAEEFKLRTKDNECPSKWSGIWTMTTK